MCDRATSIVASVGKENRSRQRRKFVGRGQKKRREKNFSKGREDIHQGKGEVNRNSAEEALKDAVQKAFDKVRRASLAGSGLRSPDMFTVEIKRDKVFEAASALFPKLFNENVQVVDGVITKEFDELEQVVAGNLKRELQKTGEIVAQASRVAEGKVPALSADILSDTPLKPWDLRNYGTTQAEVQKKTSQAVKESDEKPKADPKDNKKLLTDLII